MFKSIFTDRRVWLLGIILVAVALVARWLLPAQLAMRGVITGGYWVILVLMMMFGRAVWPVMRERWRQASFQRFEIWVAAGILVVSGIWFSHERPGYKILADELLLSGTAMSLHYERMATYPTRATDIQGPFLILSRTLDKRPLLFPMLVSAVHDVTGYRISNSFYLNMVLGAAFLWLVYLAGWNAGGSRWAGVLMALLFAGLPLMAQQATGGGFELLNLLLLVVLGLLMTIYLERPEKGRLEALVFCGLLLASTRYESVIFLVPVAIVALLGWWRSEKIILSWPLIFSPLFLVLPLMQNRVFVENTAAWEMGSRTGVTEPFGFEYLAPNLGHALEFFFDFGGYHANSPLFAALGLLCLPFLILWTRRIFGAAKTAQASDLGWAVAALGLLGVTAVYMLYFWGTFDDPLISRLSLPVHLLMAVAVVIVGAMVFKTGDRGWKILTLVALGGFLFQSLPVMARQAYRTSYFPGVKMQIRQNFLETLTDRNVLVIDNDSFYWILQKIPASPVKQSILRKEGLRYHLRNHSFQAIYVFQSVKVNDQTGEMIVDPQDDLGADFELTPVWEKRVETLLFARISRVVAISEQGKETVRATRFINPEEQARTKEELEAARSLYLKKWIQQLP